MAGRRFKRRVTLRPGSHSSLVFRDLHLVNPILMFFFVRAKYDKLWRCMISLNEKVRHHQQDAFVPWHLTIFDHENVTRKSQNPAVATGHRVDVGESALHDRPLVTWPLFRSSRPHHIFSQLGMRERGWLRRRTLGSNQVINGNQM